MQSKLFSRSQLAIVTSNSSLAECQHANIVVFFSSLIKPKAVCTLSHKFSRIIRLWCANIVSQCFLDNGSEMRQALRFYQ